MPEQYYYEPIYPEIVCQRKTAESNQTFPYHRHNGYEIYVFIQGNVRMYIEHECYNLGPGDIAIIPPGSMHRIVSLDDQIYELITIQIKQSAAENFSAPRTDLFACFHACGENGSALSFLSEEEHSLFVRYADRLSHSLESEEYGSDVIAHILFLHILLFVNRRYSESVSCHQSIMPPLVKDVMTYIKENLVGELSLTVLSKEFYHNSSHISRLFKQHVGLTLREYILDQRIEHAKQLLAGGCSVSEACYASGFSDYSNFIRSFSKVAQISPGRYKRTIRGEAEGA